MIVVCVLSLSKDTSRGPSSGLRAHHWRYQMKTLIKNGTVINATGSAAADVLVDGETIAALLNPGSSLLGVDLERKRRLRR